MRTMIIGSRRMPGHAQGAVDATEGYLSDVPTLGSNAGSEVSVDLVAQTKVLEKHFRDKYQILRSAYEQRIKDLTSVIQSACSNLVSDELIVEMKGDRASSAFIPTHINEVITRHLDSEREKFMHELLQKYSTLEMELGQTKQSNLKLKADSQHSERQLRQLEQTHKDQVGKLEEKLQLAMKENSKLQKITDQKAYELGVLEQSFQQSTRELAVIENIDKQSQKHQQEMQQQLVSLSKQRNALVDENNSLKAELRVLKEEFDRSQSMLSEKLGEEDRYRQRIQDMMHEVEVLLEQEANESNMAISTVHEKMKVFRSRVVFELQKEKRMNQMLTEEIQKLKAVREDSSKEYKYYMEMEKKLKDQLLQAEEKALRQQSVIDRLTSHSQEQNMKLHNVDMQNRSLIEKLAEMEIDHKREKQALYEKVKLETYVQVEKEKKQESSRDQQSLLNHIDNQLNSLNEAMVRSSLTSQANLHGVVTSKAEDDLVHYKAVLALQQEKQELIAEMRTREDELLQHVKDCEAQVRTHQQTAVACTQQIQLLQHEKGVVLQDVVRHKELLQVANHNIEKLKVMAKEGKTMLGLLQQEFKKEQENSANELRDTRRLLDQQAETLGRVQQENDRLTKQYEQLLSASKEDKQASRDVLINKLLESNEVIVRREERSQFDVAQGKIALLTESNSSLQKRVGELEATNAALTTVISTMSVNMTKYTINPGFSPVASPSHSNLSPAPVSPYHHGDRSTPDFNQSNPSGSAPASPSARRRSREAGVSASVRMRDASTMTNKEVVEEDLSATNLSKTLDAQNALDAHLKDTSAIYDLTEQVHRANLEQQLTSAKLSHLQEQYENLNTELMNKHSQCLASTNEIQTLQHVVFQLYATYTPALASLKTSLYQIKQAMAQYNAETEYASYQTFQRCQTEVLKLEESLKLSYKEKTQKMRIQLSSAHSQELNALEQRFVSQISSLNKNHTKELEKLHKEVLARTERSVGVPLFADTSVLGHSAQSFTPAAESAAAFESVLTGTLLALQEQEVLSSESSSQIQALAKTNTEPSLAAGTAAKALVCEELDKCFQKYIVNSSTSMSNNGSTYLSGINSSVVK